MYSLRCTCKVKAAGFQTEAQMQTDQEDTLMAAIASDKVRDHHAGPAPPEARAVQAQYPGEPPLN